MTETVKRTVTIEVDGKGADLAVLAAWLEGLDHLVATAPAGVTVAVADHDSFIKIDDIVNYLRGKVPPRRLHIRARAVFFWLVGQLGRKLEVWCRRCGLRRMTQEGGCRCPDRGATAEDSSWFYLGFGSTDHSKGQDHWQISEARLLTLRHDDFVGKGIGLTTRRDALKFLAYLRRRHKQKG